MEISGLVDVQSHCKQPSSFCILNVILDWVCLSVGTYGILSTGYLE